QRVERVGVGHPLGILAVVVEAVVTGEVEDVLLEQAAGVLDALVDALPVGRENRVGRLQLATLDGVVEQRLVAVEAGDVGRGEELLAAVERLQVTLVHVRRQRIVQRLRPVRVAAVRQQAVDQLGGGGLVLGRTGRQRSGRARRAHGRLGRRGQRRRRRLRAGVDRDRQRRVVGARQQGQRRGEQEGEQGGLGDHGVLRGGVRGR